MRLHEYQAKARLAQFGVPVQSGETAKAAASVPRILRRLGKGPWVVKAQVHAGGRGKAGGVALVQTPAEASAAAKKMLGMTLRTPQTGAAGERVREVLVCKAADLEREIYAAVVMDSRAGGPVFVVSASGGMEIEASSPEKILRMDVDARRGLRPSQARRAAAFVGLTGGLSSAGAEVFLGLSRAFFALDAELVEVNPLAVVKGRGGRRSLLALDAKMSIDDNALFRHPDVASMAEAAVLSAAERRARRARISYVPLDGDIGCLVNGAGLAMATLDAITLHGGRPANFLDVGGGADARQVADAFKILLSDKKIKAVLVNIFGGIMKGDVIARGILEAVRREKVRKPLIARIEGHRAEEGRALLAEAGSWISSAADLADAARQAVKAAGGRS